MPITRFLPGFSLLFGRAPKSASKLIGQHMKAIRDSAPGQCAVLFNNRIEPEKIQGPVGSKDQVYTASTTFFGMLGQAFGGGSLRKAVDEARARRCELGLSLPSTATGAYSIARKRLPQEALDAVHQRVLEKLPTPERWLAGRRTLAVDGTSVQLDDTAANQEEFPQPSGPKQGCGFPVMQVVALRDMRTGAVLKAARSPQDTHEAGLFYVELMKVIQQGDILLGDRHYCTFVNAVTLLAKGADMLMRLHGSRRWPKEIKGDDVVVDWLRPRTSDRPEHMEAEEWEGLSQSIPMRYVRVRVRRHGFRAFEIMLATTLLDVPVRKLAEMYMARWEIEQSFDDLKTAMGMAALAVKTPAMAWKMLTVHLIAHNLIRALMLEASRLPGAPELVRLSFQGAWDAAKVFAPKLAQSPPARYRRLHQALIDGIARDAVPHRPFRIEPRVLKKRQKPFSLMTRPRQQLRNKILAEILLPESPITA